ncbi:MAG: TraB/GumN family protein [Eubacteriaceae bacterium]
MSDNVHILNIDNKQIILLGTAHVSEQSVLEVDACIEQYKPDVVCVELDDERYASIKDNTKWKNTNIYEIIKQKKGMLLLANIILASYQRKIGAQLGISAGAEMIRAIKSAEEHNIKLELIDRNVKITFGRIWNSLKFGEKLKLLLSLVMSLFDETKITQEDLEEIKQQDFIASALNEMGSEFSGVKKVLVDERDIYMARKLMSSKGEVILAVIGAAHVNGIIKNINEAQVKAEKQASAESKSSDDTNTAVDISALEKVPEKKKIGKIISWSIPVIIIVLIALTFKQDVSIGLKQVLWWYVITGTCSAIGVLLALGHPLSMLTAFIMAPIAVLNPLLATGWFAGLMEAYIKKPVVNDFDKLYDDVETLRGFWSNKITKILLVTAFANLGTIAGTVISGMNIIKNLL